MVCRSLGEGKMSCLIGKSFSLARWKHSGVGCTTMWIYLTLLNYRLKNDYNCNIWYLYFTTVKNLKNKFFLELKNGRRDKSKWLLSARTLELAEQTREGWYKSLGKHKPARCKSTSVSQGSEAENLRTLGAPREGEGARVSAMFVTGVENTLHLLATPLSYRGEQLLSFTPSRWRSWLSVEIGTADGGDKFSLVAQSCPTLCDPMDMSLSEFQASLSIINSRSLLKLMSIELVMPSNHLILCRPLLLPPSIFPSIRVFSNESVLDQRFGVSASTLVLPMNIQDWFPLG